MAFTTLFFTGAMALASGMAVASSFSEAERTAVLKYWDQPDRYVAGIPENTPLQIRQTVEGSTWMWNYNRARGFGKTPPNQLPPPLNERQKVWEAWINAKVGYDWYLTARQAGVPSKASAATVIDAGPIPEDLAELVGNPPPFAEAVQPKTYRVTFGDGGEHVFVDHKLLAPRYAYYRFSNGVMAAGSPTRNMPEKELNRLCERAGIDGAMRRVMAAVSLLEGGFDSVNTYDTGYVSIGFMQFAALKEGGGSLGQMLLRFKTEEPKKFDLAFRRFGLDVNPLGIVVALDLTSGVERTGYEANRAIIDDKRLTAVFQRAGRESEEFRIAQLKAAKDLYYPASDLVTVTIDGVQQSLNVAKIFQSEAGMATLMDRKVNTGKLDPINTVAQRFVDMYSLASLGELANFEAEMIAALQYRKNYLADSSLSAPKKLTRDLTSRAARSSRQGRKPRARGAGLGGKA